MLAGAAAISRLGLGRIYVQALSVAAGRPQVLASCWPEISFPCHVGFCIQWPIAVTAKQLDPPRAGDPGGRH